MELFQAPQTGPLFVAEVLRILQPNAAAALEKLWIRFFQLRRFLPPHLIHGLQKVLDEVELVEDQRHPGQLLLHPVDVGLPRARCRRVDLVVAAKHEHTLVQTSGTRIEWLLRMR